VIFENLCFTW